MRFFALQKLNIIRQHTCGILEAIQNYNLIIKMQRNCKKWVRWLQFEVSLEAFQFRTDD